MTGEVIVKDTIVITPTYGDVFSVSALVTSGTREEGKTVNILWNSGSGTDALATRLIEAYTDLTASQPATLQSVVREAIGTDVAAVEPELPVDPTVTITASSVTVNQGGV